MNILSRTTAAVATLAAALLFNVPAAHADNFDWVANGNASFPNNTTARFAVANDGGFGYVYNLNVDHQVHSGDVVSFHMDTVQETYCTDFYPYVYVVVDGRGFASYQDGTPCTGDQKNTLDDGNVTFTVTEDGTLTYAEIGYVDNDGNGVGGTVEISDLRVNGEQILFSPNPPPPDTTCDGTASDPDCAHVATPYGATLAKNYSRCRVRIYDFLDAPLKGQYADPQTRTFVTRVDGRVRANEVLQAGQEDRTRFHIKPHTGKRIVTVKTDDGQLLDRMKFRSGRC